MQQLLKPQNARGLLHFLVHHFLGRAGQLHGKGHVLIDGHMRIKRVVLEHHRDIAILGRHLIHHPVADRDLTTRDILKPRQHAQQGGFAAAGRPDQHNELPVFDIHAHAMQNLRGTEGLSDVANFYCRHTLFLPGLRFTAFIGVILLFPST